MRRVFALKLYNGNAYYYQNSLNLDRKLHRPPFHNLMTPRYVTLSFTDWYKNKSTFA